MAFCYRFLGVLEPVMSLATETLIIATAFWCKKAVANVAIPSEERQGDITGWNSFSRAQALPPRTSGVNARMPR
jgi:hypothetical protein